jgi:Sigma-70, region 4
VARSELTRDLNQAVDDLPSGQREAARVFYLDGLGYADAAAALGIGLSALKVRLHAARGTLKHHYRLEEAAWPQTVRPSARTLATHEAGPRCVALEIGRLSPARLD